MHDRESRSFSPSERRRRDEDGYHRRGSPSPGRRDRYREKERREDSRSRSRSRSWSRDRRRSRYSRGPSTSPLSRRKRHVGDRDNPDPSRVLGVFNLTLRTSERDLYRIFEKFGRLEKITVVVDAQTRQSRGFAFVYYERLEDARAAKEECCGMDVDGRRIRVDFSITKRAHTPTPGVYMGRRGPRFYDRDRRSRSPRRRDIVRYERSRSRSREYRGRR